MTSLEAAAQYPDDSLSFVLLDASHTYKDVAADIEAWLPKVKSGGILAGDDYHHTWQGVVDAVDELLPDAEIIDNVSWAYRKP
jgi:cephalosporin hydroxylase